MQSYLKRAFFSVGTLTLLGVIGAVFGYVLRMYFAHIMTVEQFGLFYAVYGLLAFIFTFRDLGLGKALVKYISEYVVDGKKVAIKSAIVFVFLENIVVSLILFTLIFFSADFIALHYFSSPHATLIIQLIGLSFLLQSFVDVTRWTFLGFQRMTAYGAIHHLKIVPIFVIALFLFKTMDGLLAASFAYVLYPFVLLLFFLPYLFKSVFPDFFSLSMSMNQTKTVARKLVAFGIPQTITKSGTLLLHYIDTITLTLFRGVVEVGIYNVALPTAKLVTFGSESLASFLVPFSSEMWTKDNKEPLREGISLLYKWTLLLNLPIVVVLILCADTIIALLFGSDYILAVIPLQILALGSIALFFYSINFAIFSGINQPKINAKIMGVAALLNLFLNFSLIPQYGVVGASIATALSFFAIFCMSMYYLRQFIVINYPFLIWAKTLAAASFMCLFMFLVKHLTEWNAIFDLLIIVPLGFIVYVFFAFLFKVVEISEIRHLLQRAFAKK